MRGASVRDLGKGFRHEWRCRVMRGVLSRIMFMRGEIFVFCTLLNTRNHGAIWMDTGVIHNIWSLDASRSRVEKSLIYPAIQSIHPLHGNLVARDTVKQI